MWDNRKPLSSCGELGIFPLRMECFAWQFEATCSWLFFSFCLLDISKIFPSPFPGRLPLRKNILQEDGWIHVRNPYYRYCSARTIYLLIYQQFNKSWFTSLCPWLVTFFMFSKCTTLWTSSSNILLNWISLLTSLVYLCKINKLFVSHFLLWLCQDFIKSIVDLCSDDF